MKVYHSWTRTEFISKHLPDEFKIVAATLSSTEIEKLSEAIGLYYCRICRSFKKEK